MKVTVQRGETFEIHGRYIKVCYVLESDDIPLKDIDKIKDLLEKIITGWLNNAKQEIINNGNGDLNPERKPEKGFCSVCGKKINPKYRICYECWLKHQEVQKCQT